MCLGGNFQEGCVGDIEMSECGVNFICHHKLYLPETYL